MKKLVHWPDYINSFFENGSEIPPLKGQKVYYELLEVEVFKILNN